MGASVGGGGTNWDNDDGSSFKPVAEINVTPLVDVMLVLLIVFMVAAPMMTVGVPIQLPKTAAAKSTEPKDPIVLSIDKQGKVFLTDEEVGEDVLLERLSTLAGEDKERIVLVRGDREIQYGRLMEVMGQVSEAGFQKVSLIAEMARPASTEPPSPANNEEAAGAQNVTEPNSVPTDAPAASAPVAPLDAPPLAPIPISPAPSGFEPQAVPAMPAEPSTP